MDNVLKASVLRGKPFMERSGEEQDYLYYFWFDNQNAKEIPLNKFLGMTLEQFDAWREGTLCLNDGSYHEMEPSWFRLSDEAVAAARKILTFDKSYDEARADFFAHISKDHSCTLSIDYELYYLGKQINEIAEKTTYLEVFDPGERLVAIISMTDILYKEDFAQMMKDACLKATEKIFLEEVYANFTYPPRHWKVSEMSIRELAQKSINLVCDMRLKEQANKESLDKQILSAFTRVGVSKLASHSMTKEPEI